MNKNQCLLQVPAVEIKTPDHGDSAAKDRALPSGITDFPGLAKAVPLSPRSLRTGIKEGLIPVIRLPGGRRLLFHLPSVEKALLRFQRGGME